MQVLPGAVAAGAKSAALSPEVDTVPTVTGRPPVLITVAVWAALAVPTTWLAKVRLVGPAATLATSGADTVQPRAGAGPGTKPTSHCVISLTRIGTAPSQMPRPAPAMARAWSAAERPANLAVQLDDPGAS